jgi:hypothetical protein
MEDEKITIIEGPPPTFEIVYDVWANGIFDSSSQANVAVTKLRTFNGPKLIERCYHAWKKRELINLEFRSPDGMTMEVPIVAARTTDSDDGNLLLLWVRLPDSEIEIDFDLFIDNDLTDEDDDIEDDGFNPSI